MRIPNSAVIILHSTGQTPDDYTITLEYPGGSASYKVPVLKLADYSMESLFERRLLLLVPFLPLQFAERLGEMDRDGGMIGEVYDAFDNLNARLDAMVLAGELDEVQKQHLIDWTLHVLEKLAANYKNVMGGVNEMMKGYILHTRTDDILDQGIQQGLKQGLKQGIQQGVQQGLQQGIQQGNWQGRQEDAARMSDDGLPVEKIAQYVGESVETVREWLAAAPALA